VIRSLRRSVLVLAALILLPAGPAWAHRGHGSLSVVEIDAVTGNVTVSHRLEVHDTEPALALLAPEAQPSLDDPEAVRALIDYVGRNFALRIRGRVVPLVLKDSVIGASDVRLVYAARIAPRDTGGVIDVRSTLLSEVYGDQINQVNIRRRGITRTLTFRGPGAETQSLDALN
jgi:hypothetical protein